MVLKKKEIEAFKERLETLRLQLNQSIKKTSSQAKDVDSSSLYSQHQADQGTDDYDRTVNLEVSTQDMSTLKQVERALEKIEDGTYGICDITNEPIPKARLDAIPWATMTVKAQEDLEKEAGGV